MINFFKKKRKDRARIPQELIEDLRLFIEKNYEPEASFELSVSEDTIGIFKSEADYDRFGSDSSDGTAEYHTVPLQTMTVADSAPSEPYYAEDSAYETDAAGMLFPDDYASGSCMPEMDLAVPVPESHASEDYALESESPVIGYAAPTPESYAPESCAAENGFPDPAREMRTASTGISGRSEKRAKSRRYTGSPDRTDRRFNARRDTGSPDRSETDIMSRRDTGSLDRSEIDIMSRRDTGSLDDLIANMGLTFQQDLLRRIDDKGVNDSEIYKKANLDRRHFSKIRCNVNYKPSKLTALALAIALELNLDETADLLGRAGLALSPSNLTDLIVKYCIINRIYDIGTVNELLFEHDQQLIGG